jgi:predicted DCC family thiol-disulfide oxidoreductase YuxK
VEPNATLIYDADCGFCTTAATWAQRHFAGSSHSTIRASDTVTDQELEQWRLTRDDLASAAYWIEGGAASRGHLAIAKALAAGTGFWRLVGLAISVPPGSWLAAALYPVVVRYRHRLPGATASCEVTRTAQ